MSRSLCTFPGRHGDLLWALPTVRAIAEATGAPVDLQIGQEYGGIVPLLQAQPYLADVKARPGWVGDRAILEEGWQAPETGGYDTVLQLGYRAWPRRALPVETYRLAQQEWPERLPVAVDLTRPWITAPASTRPWFYSRHGARALAVGFSDEYFELKYGVYNLLDQRNVRWNLQPCMGGGRWFDEAGEGGLSWIEAAQLLAQAEIFVGCCSSLHVLAVALGTPVVAMEPAKDRWNDIFWPLGKVGPPVTLVLGGDGLPTFDARHVGDAIEQALAR